MKVFAPLSVLLGCVLGAASAQSSQQQDSTNPSSGSVIIYIVIAVIVVLFFIVGFFVWKRKQNRKHEVDGGYGLPSTTRGTSRGTVGGTVFERRMDSTGYSNKKASNYQSRTSQQSRQSRQSRHSQGRLDRPPQWPANGAPTYTRQQQYNQHFPQQQYQPYQPQYDQSLFPPPPEVPMLEPNANDLAMSMRDLQQSQVSVPSTVEGVHKRQIDPEVIARTKEAAEKVMAEFETDPDFDERWIPYESLYFTRVISKGAFGEVWLAQLENTQVAVKKILEEKKHDVKEIECFGAEIKLMAMFKHPKIVGFVGVSWSAEQDLCAITEFMAKGDLYGYLERRKGHLNWPDHKVYLAEDIAEALVYLHSLSPKVIHRDLKSKNILLDNKYRAKLSDFGISRKRSVEETMTAGVGTIYWTAPEVLMGKKYTEKADIYSFGIVMSEMDTCAVPYSDKRDDQGKKLQGMKIIQMVIRMALRPSFQAECPEPIKELAARCLDAEPDERPDAPELLQILRDIQEDLQ